MKMPPSRLTKAPLIPTQLGSSPKAKPLSRCPFLGRDAQWAEVFIHRPVGYGQQNLQEACHSTPLPYSYPPIT